MFSCLASAAEKADRVVVFKAKEEMQLLQGDQVIRKYAVSFGANPKGHKVQEGDERTPEGDYVIDYRNPNSSYHLSLHISYPNAKDTQNAESMGVNPGGNIMIHGLPNNFGWAGWFLSWFNWTNGCIAVNSNKEMEEIWQLVPNGTPISIQE